MNNVLKIRIKDRLYDSRRTGNFVLSGEEIKEREKNKNMIWKKRGSKISNSSKQVGKNLYFLHNMAFNEDIISIGLKPELLEE